MRKVVLTFLILAVVSPCIAKYSGGTGEPNTPYQIANVADLMTLANDANDYNKCFIMTADISLASSFTTAVIARDINNANSIFDGNAFTGVFDGARHKITNMTINIGGVRKDYLGLFGDINSGEVKNLGLKNVSITGVENFEPDSESMGGLAGYNAGIISNCYSTGTVSSGTGLGGLVGYNAGSISDCYSTCTVSSGSSGPIRGSSGVIIGGFVGCNTGIISNCYSTGGAGGGDYSAYIGGLVGYNNGSISDCYSISTVGGGYHSGSIGGLVGINYSGSVSGCYAMGDVTGVETSIYLGGLVGLNYGGSISGCYAMGDVYGFKNSIYLGGLAGGNDANISNCYSTGIVTGFSGSSNLGGLAGKNDANISNCYSTGHVSGSSPLGGLVGSGVAVSGSYFLAGSGPSNGYGIPLTDAQMKQQSRFVGWDFVWETTNGTDDIWAICEGVSYPKLAWQFIAGDTDNDKDVNFIDFAAMGNKWMQADSNLYCGGADLTGDGIVDISDLAAFSSNWLTGL